MAVQCGRLRQVDTGRSLLARCRRVVEARAGLPLFVRSRRRRAGAETLARLRKEVYAKRSMPQPLLGSTAMLSGRCASSF
jgi:hypothetical protein